MLIGDPNHLDYLIAGSKINHLGRWSRTAGHRHNKQAGAAMFSKKKSNASRKESSYGTRSRMETFKKFQNIEAELNKLENDIAKRQMTPQESLNRKRLQQDLWRAALSHKSLMRQKARSRWIKEGDCNSRYFHLMINSNHKSNAVTGVSMARGWRNQTE